jgi:hypothetical protein
LSATGKAIRDGQCSINTSVCQSKPTQKIIIRPEVSIGIDTSLLKKRRIDKLIVFLIGPFPAGIF